MNMLFHKEYPCYLAIYTAAKNNKIMVLGTRYRPGATASWASVSDSL